ncbi:hypothetical protein J6590_051563 [Homalodisca vitripennis]|nr:hypothetical protein J6590_051563 [Homalodisca vitripennis]
MCARAECARENLCVVRCAVRPRVTPGRGKGLTITTDYREGRMRGRPGSPAEWRCRDSQAIKVAPATNRTGAWVHDTKGSSDKILVWTWFSETMDTIQCNPSYLPHPVPIRFFFIHDSQF